MLIYSHRGYHVEAPENTQRAFEEAWRLGVDGIETDIRLSADGWPVLFHDRHTIAGPAVAALPLGELSAAAGYEVPTLNAVVQRWPDRAWNWEIKVPEAWDVTRAVLEECPQQDRFLITSFWHSVVYRC